MPYPIGTEANQVVAIEITGDDKLRVHKGKIGNLVVSQDVRLANVGGSVIFDVLIAVGSSATVTLEAMAWPDDYGEVQSFVLGEGRPFGNGDLPYGPQAAGKKPDRSKRFIFTSGLLKYHGSNFSQGRLGSLNAGGTPAFTGQLELAPFKNVSVVSYLIVVRVNGASTGTVDFSTDITFTGSPATKSIALR